MNNDTNQNQGQNQIPDIQDIQKIQSNKNSQNNQGNHNNMTQRNPEQNPPRQARQNPGNAVVPSKRPNQPSQSNPNQNRAVQPQRQRANPVVAPRRPAPPDSQQRPNPQRQPGQKPETVRDANMSDEFQSGHTRTFDKTDKDRNINNPGSGSNSNSGSNSAKSTQTRNSDGTYHYTGRDIKSSRQRFSDSDDAIPRKRTPYEDDGSMKISVNKEKIKTKNKNAEAESKRSGSILAGILKVVLYILGVIVISGIIAYNMIMMANDVFAFVKEAVAVNVTIPENVDIKQISQILHENHLIKYPKIFNLYIKLRKKDKTWNKETEEFVPAEFEAGSYTVSSDMNYDDFIYTFKKKAATREAVRITIPEGWTIDQIIDEFVINNNIGTRDEFVKVINKTDFSEYGYRFLKALYETELSPDRKYRLEGYLFPDTYDFFRDEKELNIILRFLDNFNTKFDQECYNKCEILDKTYLQTTGRHFTIDDVVNLASIVEREARHPADFEPISAVFHNRLLHSAAFPRLESDATILYSLGHKSDLTDEDLQRDLPYNTYKRNGLPPSAICNPGYEAIFAALWPEENSPYYFFVANVKTGKVYYGKTNTEHAANKILAKSEN